MAIAYVDDSATIGSSEYFLASDSTTKVDQTDDCLLEAEIDFGALAAGDEYEWRLLEKVNGGTQKTVWRGIIIGAQSSPLVLPAVIVGEGWEIGVKKLNGTDRSIRWSFRKITPVSAFINDSATIGTTEYFLASDSTTKVDQTDNCLLQVWIDFNNLVSAGTNDEYEWRVLEAIAGGTQRDMIGPYRQIGDQAGFLVLPLRHLGDAWEIGVKKIAGTDREIHWSLRKV